MTHQWETIADDLASALGDFNHDWAKETRGSMYRDCHEAMIAYYEAKGIDWRKWLREHGQKSCKCHPPRTNVPDVVTP